MYACQKAAKRKFSSFNYKGKWTEEEEVTLLELAKVLDRSWTKIAEELNRTPENCRDKFRELGGLGQDNRRKGKWSLEEKLELIRLVNYYSENQFIKREAVCDYNDKDSIAFRKDLNEKEEKLKERGYKKTNKHVHLYREFELADIVDLIITDPEDVPPNNLPWSKIAEDMV